MGMVLQSEDLPHPPGVLALLVGEGQLEPGGPHSGPSLPLRGDTSDGGGHSLDLPAGCL